jgi:hypothetical protein
MVNEPANDKSYIEHSPGADSFVGERAVNVFAMITLAHGLKLYAKARIRPNRHYTPKNMMIWAERWTGQTFKKRAYAEAAEALLARAAAIRATLPEATRT